MDKIRSWLPTAGEYMLHKALPGIILAVIGILVIQLVGRILKVALKKTKLETAAHTLIRSLVKVVLYLVLGLAVASWMGIDVTGVIAMASVLTLAISLALQTALSNVIGGFSLLYTDPFDSGDFVEIAGQSGMVKEIGLTYTRLITADNKVVSIPNSAVVAAQIVNYTTTGTRRVEINVSAAYTTPVEKVLEALRQASDVATALQTPAPVVAVKAYGDSTIDYVMFVWCNSADYWTTLFEINKNVKTVFDEKGVEMTYPHLNVHLDK